MPTLYIFLVVVGRALLSTDTFIYFHSVFHRIEFKSKCRAERTLDPVHIINLKKCNGKLLNEYNIIICKLEK